MVHEKRDFPDEYPGAGPVSGESHSANRGIILKVERILYRAAVLGGEFSGRFLQRPQDGVR